MSRRSAGAGGMDFGMQKDEDDICLVDSATPHSILKNQKFFSTLEFNTEKVCTIARPAQIIEGSGRAHILLPNGTHLFLQNALYSSSSRRNLLSFIDIRKNGYHIATKNEGNKEFMCITSNVRSQKLTLEKFSILSLGLYYTIIGIVRSHTIISQKLKGSQKLNDPNTVILWHDRLGHPGSTMLKKIVDNSNGHLLANQQLNLSNGYKCVTCSQRRLITRPSFPKITLESPSFLQRIQGDICGPIHPASGPFRYYMVLLDASTRWSHVCLLSTRNLAFARILAQIIKLRAHFPDQPINSIRLDNAVEFTSQVFDDYCSSIGIDVEHPVPHVHTQNGLAESLIKRLQLVARFLLMQSRLPASAWGHAILHAAMLLRLRPTSYHQFSPTQLVTGCQPNISHLRKFGCAVQVPISPSKRTTMSPQRCLGIYVGFDSPFIIRYLEPLSGDIFTARFADCQFDETKFPLLEREKKVHNKLLWNTSTLSHMDPITPQCDYEIRRILHLQEIAKQLPDAFNDATKVTKSHVPAMNAPARIRVPEGQTSNTAANESVACQKRDRPIGFEEAPEEAIHNPPEEGMYQKPTRKIRLHM